MFAERDRDVDAQPALRPVASQLELVIGCLDLREDAPAMFQVHRTLGRHADAARGAMQEAGTQVFFELRDITARHGARHVHGVRGPGERAEFRNPREHTHSEQLIHDGDCKAAADNEFGFVRFF